MGSVTLPVAETTIELPSLPRVVYQHLLHEVVCEEWETAIEKLSISLCKHNVAVISLPEDATSANGNAVERLTVMFEQPASSKALLQTKNHAAQGYSTRVGEENYRVRLGCSALSKLGDDGMKQLLEKAYTTNDGIARLVLQYVCRSNHLRLRCDTFSHLLDDRPLPRNTVSSSVLHAQRGSNSMLCTDRPEKLKLAQEHQYDGLLTVITAREATAGTSQLSTLQVKAADEKWIDVNLKQDEVAVLIGRTAEYATAGLLKASTFRVVGNTGAGSKRLSLAYELNARSAAFIELSGPLQEAGHEVPERGQPFTAKELIEQFNSVLTPTNRTAAESSAGTSTASDYMCLETMSSLKRCRKRQVLGELGSGDTMTRSGNVRRNSDGEMINAKPARKPRKKMSERPSSVAADAVAGVAKPTSDKKMCIMLDVRQDNDTSNFVTLMVMGLYGNEMWFKVRPSNLCGRIFERYCDMMGVDLATVKFMYNGNRIFGSSTPSELNMLSGDQILMMPCNDDFGKTKQSLLPKPAAPLKDVKTEEGMEEDTV